MMANKLVWIAVLCMAAFVVAGIYTPAFEITRSTIDGGGAMFSHGAGFELSGTIGQPDAGVLTSERFQLTGGFWFELPPTDCNDDGVVNLLDINQFIPCFSGPQDAIRPGCACFDINRDDTVDLRDFYTAQRVFTEP